MAGVVSVIKLVRGGRRMTHVARGGTATLVVGGILAAAFASGYSATRALTSGDSAWLRKGDTIVHVNGPSGRFDAVVADHPTALAGSRSDPMEVVQEADGQVYTADPVTHQVYRVDPVTMAPQPGPQGTAVLASGSTTYVVDGQAGTITPVDPQTLVPGRPIRVPGPIASQAIGPDGTAYLAGTNGTVTTVKAGQAKTTQVAGPGQPLDLTIAGGQPAAVDPVNGVLYPLGAGQSPSLRLPGVGGAPVQLAGSLSGPTVWLVRGALLVSADPGTGQTQSAGLPNGDTYGAPVVNVNRVYVADDSRGSVLAFDTSTLTQVNQIAVPAGAPGSHQIEMVVQDGKVWIDNPTSRDAKLVSPDGTTVTLDKGTGNQVVDPNAPPRPAPAPSPSPSPVAPPAGGPPIVAGPVVTGPFVPQAPVGVAPTAPVPTVRIPSPASPPVSALPPVTSPPAQPPPSTTAPQKSGTVPKVTGLAPTAACSAIQGASPPLTCSPHDQGQAPGGTAAGVVTAQSPAAGSPATAGTPVTFDYYGSLAVPGFSGKAPGAYCATADSLGLKCSTSASQGPYGAQTNVVESVTPGAGSIVPYGTPVTASYYSSTAGPPQETVPDCNGDAPSTCPNPGLTYVPVSQTVASAVACNTVYQESPPAGTVVNQGSQVDLYYDPYCFVGLYEWNRQGTEIWYLSTSSATPANSTPTNPWVSHGAAAGIYPLVNGGCAKAGTTKLLSWQYNTSSYQHHYFTIDSSWHDPGWSGGGAIGCVFTTHVARSITVWGYYINRGQPPPGNWFWDLKQAANGVITWYQPPA